MIFSKYKIRADIDVAFFFVIKPTRCNNFTNLFCHETLHVSDSSSVHNQEFIHCTFRNESSWWPVGTQLEFLLKLCTYKPPGTLIQSDGTICCLYTTMSS